MDKLAFVYGDVLVYWSSIVMTLALFTGIVLFFATYLLGKNRIMGAFLACPAAVALSMLLARLVYWYFRVDSYSGLTAAITDFSETGYALIGAFAGCLLTAVILRVFRIVDNLPGMLDCMSIGGCAAIAVGRLSCFFNTSDRGAILGNAVQQPWASPIVNATSAQVEYRFSTFLFQSVIAWGILIVLLVMLWRGRKEKRHGDITLVFLLLYCASQIVLDSTRYDALRFRSNGFVSVVQVLCAIALVAVMIIFSVQLIKKHGRKLSCIAIWSVVTLGLCGAGYMEYYVQRHGDRALTVYVLMSGCLGVVVILGMLLRHMANRGSNRKNRTVRCIREVNE